MTLSSKALEAQCPNAKLPPQCSSMLQTLMLASRAWPTVVITECSLSCTATLISYLQSRAKTLMLSGHYSRDWSEYVNVIGVIREPFAREFR